MAELSLLALPGLALDKTFLLNGTNATLTEVTDEVGVRFGAMRFNPTSSRWSLDLALTNKSYRAMPGPLVVLIDGFSGTSGPQQPDATDGGNPAKAYYDFTTLSEEGQLWPGETSGIRTVQLGFNGGSPNLIPRVFANLAAAGPGLALVRTLTELGQPFPGVTVLETGPGGNVTRTTDSTFALATLGGSNGEHTWMFSAPERLPVWRRESLRPGEVTLVFNPRLTPRMAPVLIPLAGGSLTTSNGGIRVQFSPGAFSQNASASLTPLTAQTLPMFLPLGWSPLQAWSLELSAEPSIPIQAAVLPWGSIHLAEQGALVRWNVQNFRWEVVQLFPGAQTNSVTVTLPGSATYALVVADVGATAPPPAQPGQPLPSGSGGLASYDSLTAGGQVSPGVSLASSVPELVTATARIAITNQANGLVSGLPLRCEVQEQYQLRDGTRRTPPQYENFVIGYQRPGDASPSTLHASFPMQPLLLFGRDTLDVATVNVDVLPLKTFTGRVLDSRGGQVPGAGVVVSAGVGDLTSRQAIQLRALNPTNFADSIRLPVWNAFDLSVGGIAEGHRLSLQVSGLPTNSYFVLARVLSSVGHYGLEPIERLLSDSNGVLKSLEPVSGDRLPGITGAGQYLLVQVSAPQGLIRGIAKDVQGQAVAGLPVRVTGQPWLTYSGSNGSYRLVAPVGSVEVVTTDPRTGDLGLKAVTVANPNLGVTADIGAVPSGPRVVSVTPTNSAVSVSRVTSIVIRFSEPINPGTLVSNSVQLLGASNQPVALSRTLNLQNTILTLIPAAQLSASTLHTIQLATNLTDTTGLPLEGPRQFTFTTESDVLIRQVAQVISYEPTNGFAAMYGSPGTAEPNSAVILVNETSGQTATVLSKPDGSFSNSVPASVDDFLSAALVNKNGTRNTIPVSRQIYRDGSVGLFNGGGILEAQGDGGPVQVIVEPGAIANKTTFKFQTVPFAELMEAVDNTRPENGGRLLGGIKLSASGDPLQVSVDVSFPIDSNHLGLPAGTRPEDASFALVVPRKLNGMIIYEEVDRMHFENGRLVTHSPPFLGLLPFAPVLAAPMLLSVGNTIPIFGQVREVNLDENDAIVGTPRALAGALVRMNPAGKPAADVHPGTIYATTSDKGKYAFLVPVDSLGGAAFTMVASHVKYPTITAISTAVLPSVIDRVLIGNVLGITVDFKTRNLSTIGGTPADREPPNIRIFHSPNRPAVSDVASVTVVGTDGNSRPTVGLTLDGVLSLVDGVTASDQDVVISAGGSEPVGDRGIRSTFTVSARKALTAAFTATAADVSGNLATSKYVIGFGGASSAPPSSIPSDPNDSVGPQVVFTWPGQKAGISPGQPIVVVFGEPIDPAVLADSFPVQLSPDAGLPALRLSPDRRELTIAYYNLQHGQDYSLTLTSGIRDLRGNPLDQIPATLDTLDSFNLRFSTLPANASALPGVDFGGGVVTRGIYAYALDRKGLHDGNLMVFDLSDPQRPQLVSELDLPSYPRDLVLIPSYSFQRRPVGAPNLQSPGDNIETKDLLAICGGLVTGNADGGGGQFLWVVDISDPAHPQRVASTLLTLSTTAVVPKLAWSPPLLSYLSAEPNADAIGQINLQAFIYGENLSQAEFLGLDVDFREGLDKNGDGDFVDAGEQLPLPGRINPFFPGLVQFVTVGSETSQRMVDFCAEDGGRFVAAVIGAGVGLDATGLPANPSVAVRPCYRTLLAAGELLERVPASYDFQPGDQPRRVQTFPGTTLKNGAIESIADLALVTLNERSLVILDITDPLHPIRINTLSFPVEHGTLYGVQARADGKLVLATANDLLLLDASRLGLEQPDPARPPAALVGLVPGAGSGVRSFGMDLNGLYAVNAGGKRQIIQTAPLMKFVSFEGLTPFNPADLAGRSAQHLAQTLDRLRETDSLRISRYKPQAPDVSSSLSPPSPNTHFYTLVYAPGSSGASIDLTLESLNRSGYPLKNRGLLFPPVRALGEAAQSDLGQTARACDAPTRANRAWRLSSNPASSNYNMYLGRPFALIYEAAKPGELEAIRTDLDRDVLWSGNFLRASLDPSLNNNRVLHAFAARVDLGEKVIRPSVSLVAGAFPADYLMGPNPPPIIGGVAAPAVFGSISVHNGEVAIAATDLQLPGRRLPIEFRRASRSQGLYEGPFGRGWDFNYNQRVLELGEQYVLPGTVVPFVTRQNLVDSERGGAGDVCLHTGTGRVLIYRYAGTNAPTEFKHDPLVRQLGWDQKAFRFYTTPRGSFNMLVKFGDGRFARLEPDGTQFWYGPQGRLEVMYDRYEKNSVRCSYNERGDLVQIVDEVNRSLELGYYRLPGDPELRTGLDEATSNVFIAGKICRLKDYSGRDVLFHYDDEGVLERREGPNVTVAGPGGFLGRQVTRYLVSDCSDPDKTARSLVGVQSGSSAGNPLMAATEVGRTGRDVATQLMTPTGPVSLSMTHANSAQALSQGGGSSKVVGQDGSVTEYGLDKHGRALIVKLSGAQGAEESTQFEYTDDGLVKKLIYPEGNYEEFTYDEVNQNLRCRANLVRIVKHPGPRGGNILTSSSSYDAYYNMAISKTDFAANTATITLSSDKREASVVQIGNEFERYLRNQFGQMISYTTADGVSNHFEYNDNGFLEKKSVGAMTSRYGYQGASGKLGQPSVVTDPNGVATELVYDERNQLVKQSREGRVEENSYDERGFLTKQTSVLDSGATVVEDRVYDQLGFMLSRTRRGIEVSGSAQDLSEIFEPDASSRLKKATYPNSEIHEFGYDHLGRVTLHKVGDYVEESTYDRNGNLLTSKIGDGVETYEYDGHDRLVKTTTPNGGIIDYTFNGNNQPLSQIITDPTDGVISYTTYAYDERGRQKQVIRHGDQADSTVLYEYAPGLTTMVDAAGAVARTYFDSSGRVTKEELPSRTIEYSHDAADNVVRKDSIEGGRRFTQSYYYNRRDQVTNVLDALGNATSFGVGLDGRLLRVTDREQNTTVKAYNSIGELNSILPADGVSLSYAHNPNREVESIRDKNQNGVFHLYDSQGRLAKSTYADGAQSIYADFDARNCAQSVSMPGGVSIQSTFDKEGRLLTRVVSGGGGGSAETYRFDSLSRLRRVEDASGSVEYVYDKLGYTKSIIAQQEGHIYRLDQTADPAGFRTNVSYPSGIGVQTERDSAGRLIKLLSHEAGAVINGTTYAAHQLIGSRLYGSNILSLTASYDDLKRPTKRRFVRNSDGETLFEVRYVYNRNGAQVARQFLHRAGRGDFFRYDSGSRLIRSDYGVRPALRGSPVRTVSGFAQPSEVTAAWSAGLWGRSYSYTDTDCLQSGALANPDNLAVPPFAAAYGLPDPMIFVSRIDGFSRQKDAAGNVTKARLWVRLPGATGAVAVDASLTYNALAQLIRVDRDDGVVVENSYSPGGLRIRRRVTGLATRCVPSDVAFVYDGGNLIEEYDLAAGNQLRARYFYGDDSDELVAADVRISNPSDLIRRYFLTDAIRSVMAVTDASGQVLERINYDAWGQPALEMTDTIAPKVATITADGEDLLIEFTESVLPAIAASPSDGLAQQLLDPGQIMEILVDGQPVSGTVSYEESRSSARFGSVFRFHPAEPVLFPFRIRIKKGTVLDEWSNPNASEDLVFTTPPAPGLPLYAGSPHGSTAPQHTARSAIGNSMLFQGHVFDFDAGLLYCRARFYDPYTGLFLQRDPAGYEDSVNHYAGFANNPVNLRDPGGSAVDEQGAWLSLVGSQATLKEDGLIGVVLGGGLKFVGAVMQLGTGLAEGLDRLENARIGPMGMVDVKEGLGLIASDLQTFAGAAALGSGLGFEAKNAVYRSPRMQAYWRSGMEYGHDVVMQKLGLRDGFDIGKKFATKAELDGIHSSLQQLRAAGLEAEMTARFGFDYEKLAYRKDWVEKGVMQKRAVDYAGKSGADARLTSKFDGKVVVSDIDIAGLKINGKAATSKQFTLFEGQANRAYKRIYKQEHGASSRPNPPFQHHGQFQVSEGFGTEFLGHTLDHHKLSLIGHPGHTVTFRLDVKGNLMVHRTPGWSVDIDVVKTDLRLRGRVRELLSNPGTAAKVPALMQARDSNLLMLPRNWFNWKE